MTQTPSYGFFSTLTHSVYSPAFYSHLTQKSFWSSVWYLVRVTLILFLLGALIILIPIFKNWDKIDQSVQNALSVYPEELVLTFQDGQMTSNQVEPYFIESRDIVPEEWRDEFLESSSADFPKNLVVIDTITPFNEEQYDAYDAVIWLTKDSAYIEKENGGIESRPLSSVPDSTLDKAFVDEKIAIWWDQMKTSLPILLVLAMVVTVIAIVIYRMVYSLILAVGALIVGSIMKLPLDFGGSYKIALHAITLPSFLSLAIILSSKTTGFYGFPFWFTLLSLLIIVINLQKGKTPKLMK